MNITSFRVLHSGWHTCYGFTVLYDPEREKLLTSPTEKKTSQTIWIIISCLLFLTSNHSIHIYLTANFFLFMCFSILVAAVVVVEVVLVVVAIV